MKILIAHTKVTGFDSKLISHDLVLRTGALLML